VTLSLDPSTSGQGGRQFHVRVLHRSYHEPTNMVMRIRNSSDQKKKEKEKELLARKIPKLTLTLISVVVACS